MIFKFAMVSQPEPTYTYHRALSIPTWINYFPIKFGHVSCSHSLRPTCIPCGNYIPTHIKMK